MGIDDGRPSNPAEPGRTAPLLTRLRGRSTTAGAWLRRHSAHALVVALVAAAAPLLIARGLDWIASDPPPPTCPGAGCDGKTDEKCAAGAETVEPKDKKKNPVRLQVRYSAYCQAVWGRLLRGEPGDQLTVRVQGGTSHGAHVAYGSDQFTPMASVGASFSVKVCAVPTTTDSRTGDWTEYCVTATDEDFEAQRS